MEKETKMFLHKLQGIKLNGEQQEEEKKTAAE